MNNIYSFVKTAEIKPCSINIHQRKMGANLKLFLPKESYCSFP